VAVEAAAGASLNGSKHLTAFAAAVTPDVAMARNSAIPIRSRRAEGRTPSSRPRAPCRCAPLGAWTCTPVATCHRWPAT